MNRCARPRPPKRPQTSTNKRCRMASKRPHRNVAPEAHSLGDDLGMEKCMQMWAEMGALKGGQMVSVKNGVETAGKNSQAKIVFFTDRSRTEQTPKCVHSPIRVRTSNISRNFSRDFSRHFSRALFFTEFLPEFLTDFLPGFFTDLFAGLFREHFHAHFHAKMHHLKVHLRATFWC